jgi:hypothetical protein
MKKDEMTPQTQPAGSMMPPRPPTRVAIGLAPGDDDDDSQRKRKQWSARMNLPLRTQTTKPAPVRARSIALGAILRKEHWIHAVLVLAMQWVLIFESGAAVDGTLTAWFTIVALVLPVPGYLWSFRGTSFLNAKRAGIIPAKVMTGIGLFGLSYVGFVMGSLIIVKGLFGR